MKTKYILLAFLLFCIGIISFSCTDLDNLNEDPNRVKEDDYDFSLADLNAVMRYGSNLDYIASNGGLAGGGDLFDRIKNNCWEPWAQYFTGGSTIANSWTEAYWGAHYSTWMSLLNGVIRDAEGKENRKNSMAVALIWRTYMLSTFADYFGPIPFSTDPLEQNPGYVALDVLHKQFFADLGNAIDMFDPALQMITKEDFIFGGDILKWKKFANTQRFNLALKLSEIDPELAKTEMKAALAADGGLLSSTGDDVLGRWYDSWANGPAYGQLTWNTYVMTSTMEKIITGIGGMEYDGTATNKHPEFVDPRGVVWFDPSPSNKDNPAMASNFQGMNVAPAVSTAPASARLSATVKSDNRRPLDQLTYIQTCFMLAEAVERGFVSTGEAGGTAKSWYEKGVSASFKRWNMEGKAAAYLASAVRNTWGTSAKYDDNTSAPGNSNLEKIVTQRYLGLFTDLSNQVWNDKRRLNLPAMDIAEIQNDGMGNWVKDKDIHNPLNYFQRAIYPQSENLNNTAKYKDGLIKLGGEDKATTPLWWASKKSDHCTSAK